MKIFLIRHAESEINAKKVYVGSKVDTGLSKKGKEQAKKIAERLKNEKIEAIYASDLKRAKETAEAIGKHHKIKIILDKRLREFDSGDFLEKYGSWEGLFIYGLKDNIKVLRQN
jgi:broad specificity phosphatase PhoE